MDEAHGFAGSSLFDREHFPQVISLLPKADHYLALKDHICPVKGGCEITREMLDLELRSTYLNASRWLEQSDACLISLWSALQTSGA